jgi:PKD repeat protein
MKPYRHNRVLLLSLLFCIALLTTTCKKAIYAPGEGDTIQLQADTTTIAPGESVTITITGVKASGHPMPDNTLVQLTVDSGKFLDLEGNEIAAVQLISGTAKAIYQSDANFTGEAVTITARSGAALVNPEQLVITIASLEIVQLFMTADPLKLPPPGGTTVITVTAYDSQQEAVPGKKIFLETTAGTLTPSSPIITDSAGKVTASLTTTEPAAVTATYKEISKTIEIEVGINDPPEAAFEFSPQNPLMGEKIYFVSTSTDSDGTIVSHHWDFGDGKPGSSEENPSHKFPVTSEAKKYQVVLTVTDDGGKKSSVAQTVAFALKENTPPAADFVFSPTNPQAGETIYFNASASIDPDGKIKSYHWDFGDNTSIINQKTPSVSHPYNPPVTTTYTVTLRVVDDDDAEGVASKEVTVEVMIDENQPPTAAFSFSPKNPRAGEEVRFNAGASTDPDGDNEDLTYEWDFGDGDDKQEKTGINPTHTYDVDEEKTFTVTLTVVDKQGAEGVATAEITVRPTPVARFTFSPSNPTTTDMVTFDASSSEGDIQFYQWFFGDGEKANVKTPVVMHPYNNSGTYTVTLKVIDVNNRTSETSMKLTVKE